MNRGLHDTRMPAPVVAILDTGYSPGLEYRLGADCDWLFVGRDWTCQQHVPIDVDGHGTGVLALLACDRPELQGVCPTCSVLIQKVDGAKAKNRQAHWADAIRHSLEFFLSMRVRGLILLASGAWGLISEVEDAVHAAGECGVPIITISHNDNLPFCRLPGRLAGRLENVICVGAHDRRLSLLQSDNGRGSNYGLETTLYAQGDDLKTLDVKGNVVSVSGTSASAVVIAGMVAQILTAFPDITCRELKGLLVESTAVGCSLPNGTSMKVFQTSLLKSKLDTRS